MGLMLKWIRGCVVDYYIENAHCGPQMKHTETSNFRFLWSHARMQCLTVVNIFGAI